jgi:predicted nucleic acid-binding protein
LVGKLSDDPHRAIHRVGVVDALVAAMAERLGQIVYTDDSEHFERLKDAGASIVVVPIRRPQR